MNHSLRTPIRILVIIHLIAVAGLSASAHEPTATSPTITQESIMSKQAQGPFDVKVIPQAPDDKTADPGIGRMLLDKRFHGDLDATSVGQMLSAMGSVKGSAGYVAIEKVTGTLHGRSGTFVLQHNATMDRGVPNLNIIVIPDTGTGQLEGLTGTMKINIAEGGKHSYVFDYSMPENK